MATAETWDVFHSDRLEIERGLSTDEVRAALARGEIHDDDLARPAGSSIPWARLADIPNLSSPELRLDEELPPTQPAEDLAPTGASEDLLPTQPTVDLKWRGATEDLVPTQHAAEFAPPEPEEELTPTQPVTEMTPTAPAEPLEAPPLAAERADNEIELIAEDHEDSFEITVDAEPEAAPSPPAPPKPSGPLRFDDVRTAATEDLDPEAFHDEPDGLGRYDLNLEPERRVNLPVEDQTELGWDMEPEEEEYDPEEEDEAAAEFTLSRSAPERVEELDLAAMVDVAFQMVLFFLVTASTILFKTLEVPKPNPESPQNSVAQASQRQPTIDDLMNDYIVVEIDPQGTIKVDHEPASPETLIEQLRKARDETHRTTMLLSADFQTPHRNAVLAYDAANEIGLRIAIARPNPSGG
jgi:biopolymer transport protein ExbD